jgi:hypothetical protein
MAAGIDKQVVRVLLGRMKSKDASHKDVREYAKLIAAFRGKKVQETVEAPAAPPLDPAPGSSVLGI